MSHSFTSLVNHIVFATKNRRPFLDEHLESALYPYICGIIRKLGGTPLQINGAENHVHLLTNVPPTVSIAEFIGKIKSNSSKWVHETMPDRFEFAWQRGYGAFSVSKSGITSVARYIENQKAHHAKRSFEDEFRELLEKHGVAYDPRYVFE